MSRCDRLTTIDAAVEERVRAFLTRSLILTDHVRIV
jgi:hypothetical protein